MKEKYILMFFGEPLAVFADEADAEEMMLSLWEEVRYCDFVEHINQTNTFKYICEEFGNPRGYKNKEEYEKKIESRAWFVINHPSNFLAEILKIKEF